MGTADISYLDNLFYETGLSMTDVIKYCSEKQLIVEDLIGVFYNLVLDRLNTLFPEMQFCKHINVYSNYLDTHYILDSTARIRLKIIRKKLENLNDSVFNWFITKT